MAQIDLTKYGITGTTEIVYNPSYEQLFEEETKPELEGYEKGRETELGAVNVMTGIYTGRSPKDKYIVVDEPMTISQVKDMVDRAIAHAEKGTRKFGRRMSRKHTDADDRVILYEKDFEF